MKVGRNTVVSLEVELSDIWGNLIERTEEPAQYLHGGHGDIFAPVEDALEGKDAMARIEVRLEPEDAFGDYDDSLLHIVDAARFPAGIEVGMRVEGSALGVQDDDAERIYTVTDIAEGKVVLDANHPLCGMALKFVGTVVGVRPATPSEVENGSADDPGSVVMRVMP